MSQLTVRFGTNYPVRVEYGRHPNVNTIGLVDNNYLRGNLGEPRPLRNESPN